MGLLSIFFGTNKIDPAEKEEYRRKRAEQTFLEYPEEGYGLDEDPVTDELMFLEIMEDDEC